MGYPSSTQYPPQSNSYPIAPAQDAIEYEFVKFHGGLFNDKHELETPDIYSSPPSEEVDAAWEDLYNECKSAYIPA